MEDTEKQESADLIRAQLSPVLSFDEIRQVELVRVKVARLSDPKKTNMIMKYLNEKLPIAPFDYLKRVKKVLPPAENAGELLIFLSTPERWDSDLSAETKQEFTTTFGVQIDEIEIPSFEPVTSTTPPANQLDNSLVLQLPIAMRLAIDEAQKSKAQGNRGIGCVVLDASGRVVASAGDATTTEQCLRHAAIVCIDKVAEKQKAELENQNGEEVDYLCTGHTAVLTREPCVMCSMALLHARISRVFYGTESPTSGGLGSVFRIHCHAPLNHHFHVYKGLEVDVCNQLNT